MAATTSGLASTGAGDVPLLLGGAAALTLSGAGLVYVTRRRGDHQ